MRSLIFTASLSFACSVVAAVDFASHEPMRPLPLPHDRPLPNGPVLYVDAAKGNDASDGSKARPWKTLEASFRRLKCPVAPEWTKTPGRPADARAPAH